MLSASIGYFLRVGVARERLLGKGVATAILLVTKDGNKGLFKCIGMESRLHSLILLQGSDYFTECFLELYGPHSLAGWFYEQISLRGKVFQLDGLKSCLLNDCFILFHLLVGDFSFFETHFQVKALSISLFDLGSCVLHQNCSLLNHADPVSEFFRLIQVVCGEDDSATGASEGGKDFP